MELRYGTKPSVVQTETISISSKNQDNGLILAGNTKQTNDHNNIEAWLIKTDSNGTEEWNKTFEGENQYANFNSV